MIRNYILIAIRHIKRQLLYSFINILGLAVGLACSLVIFLFVYKEWSHDRHFKNADRIYRVGISFFNMGQFANGPELLADVVRNEFTGVKAFTRFQKNSEEIVRAKNEDFKEIVYYVDSSFFNVFSYQLLKGDPVTAFADPNSAVITESMAQKYFGTDKVIGEVLEIGKERRPHRITGLVKDETAPSHLKASIWVSLDIPKDKQFYWTSASVYNYLLVDEGVSENQLNKLLDQVVDKHVYPVQGQPQGVTLEKYKADPNAVRFIVQPLTDVYLRSKLSLELSPGGNLANIQIFGAIAVIILVLAAVNFVNLSTARASRRAKEVGIRKSLGTSKSSLIAQFLLESIIISLVSMSMALAFAEIFRLIFHWITGQSLAIHLVSGWTNFAAVLLFAIAVGILAGLYPAFYMTNFETASVLKGTLKLSASSGFRNSLIVFQFCISIGLIICTIVIFRQMNYMEIKDLGFKQDNRVTIDNLYRMQNDIVAYRDFMKSQPGVVNATLHSGEPGSKAVMYFYTYQTASMPEALTINTYFGDDAYVDVMGYKLLKGRDFNKDLASDSASVILNQSAVEALGLEDPIGAEVNKGMKVIGVVSDFHWESLRSQIGPLAILHRGDRMKKLPYTQLALEVKNADTQTILKRAEERWKQLVPDDAFAYHYMDDNFGAILKKEAVLAKAISFFTVLAIIISCLGLFGLSAYTAETRTKEIGIRKVMGASSGNIMLLLNRQFSLLIAISAVITIPIVVYVCNLWLNTFAYHTNLSIWILVSGALAGWLISYATVLYHTMKAAKSNPVETLKYE
jgi:putative ABC transport system permease protein